MPIYEYICTHCHHAEEVLQKISDQPIKKCTQCGRNTFEKLVSASSFQLKGTGWYATDFKEKPKTPASTASPATTTSTTSSSSDEKKS